MPFRRSIAILAVLLAGFAGMISAQSQTPGPRAHHALVYDEAGRRVLLTAGSTPLNGGQSFTFYNDLWAFDGTRWTLLAETGERVSGVRLASDTARGRILSFGGYNGRSMGQLRALTGTEWQVLGTLAELPVAEPGFVFDEQRRRFVAFGGSIGMGQASGDTWEYDGATWHRGPTGPPPRHSAAMAYDEKRGRTVLFGGAGQGPRGQAPPQLDDTWEYDGSSWIARTEPGPPARLAPGMAYDSRRGRMILFGGIGAGGFLGDTWSWDGSRWTRLAETGPEPRAMGYLAYDKARDRVVLFGGRKGWPDGDLADTWEWDGSSWRRISP